PYREQRGERAAEQLLQGRTRQMRSRVLFSSVLFPAWPQRLVFVVACFGVPFGRGDPRSSELGADHSRRGRRAPPPAGVNYGSSATTALIASSMRPPRARKAPTAAIVITPRTTPYSAIVWPSSSERRAAIQVRNVMLMFHLPQAA